MWRPGKTCTWRGSALLKKLLQTIRCDKRIWKWIIRDCWNTACPFFKDISGLSRGCQGENNVHQGYSAEWCSLCVDCFEVGISKIEAKDPHKATVRPTICFHLLNEHPHSLPIYFPLSPNSHLLSDSSQLFLLILCHSSITVFVTWVIFLVFVFF